MPYHMRVYTPIGVNFFFVSEAYKIDSWRTLPRPNYWTYSFKWVPNHRDHGESKHMKSSCFISGADFFTGAGIEPETFYRYESDALYTAEPPWLGLSLLCIGNSFQTIKN